MINILVLGETEQALRDWQGRNIAAPGGNVPDFLLHRIEIDDTRFVFTTDVNEATGWEFAACVFAGEVTPAAQQRARGLIRLPMSRRVQIGYYAVRTTPPSGVFTTKPGFVP